MPVPPSTTSLESQTAYVIAPEVAEIDCSNGWEVVGAAVAHVRKVRFSLPLIDNDDKK